MDGYDIICQKLCPFIKLKPLNYEFGSSEIRWTFDIVTTGEKETKNVHVWNIPS